MSRGRTTGGGLMPMSEAEAAGLADHVWSALDHVLDPCSRFNGTRLSLVALGMVDEITVSEDGAAQISLLLDDPTCLYLVEIHREVIAAANSVPGITAATVSLRSDIFWGRERMTDVAQRQLEHRRPARVIPVSSVHRTNGAAA